MEDSDLEVTEVGWGACWLFSFLSFLFFYATGTGEMMEKYSETIIKLNTSTLGGPGFYFTQELGTVLYCTAGSRDKIASLHLCAIDFIVYSYAVRALLGNHLKYHSLASTMPHT